MYRQSIIRSAALARTTIQPRARLFSTSLHYQKSAVDSAKDGLKKVDRAVADVAVKGIDVGEAAATSIKETVQNVTGTASQEAGKAEGTASEKAGEVKGSLKEAAGSIKGQAKEAKGEVKGYAKEKGVL